MLLGNLGKREHSCADCQLLQHLLMTLKQLSVKAEKRTNFRHRKQACVEI